MLPVAPILSGVKAGVDFISAQKQLKKDENELAGLTPAFYKIQDEYYQNRNMGAEMAQGGFTQGAKDFYADQAGRGLGTGISATLQAGGSPNDIARIFSGYNDSIRQMAAADSEKQIENIKYFSKVNADLAGQKNIQWGVNEYQPYQSKLKELTQRIAADKINRNNAINSAIDGVGAFETSMMNQDLLNKLFKTGKQVENNVSGGGGIVDNGIEDPFPVLTGENKQGEGFNWYMPESKAPAIVNSGSSTETFNEAEQNEMRELINLYRQSKMQNQE